MFNFWQRLEWRLFLPPVVIGILSAATVFSVAPSLFGRQLLYLLLGVVLYWAAAFFNLGFLKKYGWWFYVLTVLSLGAGLLFGTLVRGSRRWFDLFDFRLQPSEIAKLILAFFYACFWSHLSVKWKLPNWAKFFISLLFLIPCLVLVFLEPDLGTSIILIASWLPSFFSSGVSKKFLFLFVTVCLGLSISLYQFLLKDYQRQRLVSFIYQQQDPLGVGYQMRQSIIAVGSGGWLGKGYGFGTQSHLLFLPDHHTDFIFASFAEEWGLLGSFFLLGIFVLLFYSLAGVAARSDDPFSAYLCASVFCLLLLQSIINIGMNLGLVPVVGLPLPLFSYGGSSLISSFIMLGLAQGVALSSKV